MTELTAVDLLRLGVPLRRADVLTVAEIVADQLTGPHSAGSAHHDIGPHTILLDLADAPAGGIRDARLLPPQPARRPPGWPTAPEDRPGPAADVFALGQVLRSLDAHARSATDDDGLPDWIRRMIDPDPARRPSAQDVVRMVEHGGPRHTDLPVSPEPRPVEQSTWPLALAAVAVFAVVLGGGLWWTRGGEDPAVTPTSAEQDVSARPVSTAAGEDPGTPPEESAPGAGADLPIAPEVEATVPPESPVETAEPIATQTRPAPGSSLDPSITLPPGVAPGSSSPDEHQAPGDTAFDQAWCRSHGTFTARVQTNNYQATICRDGDTVNYHGLDLTNGLAIRTPATEEGSGWTGLGEEQVTYHVSANHLEVRRGDTVLAREEVVSFIDQSQHGDYRPWDLAVDQPISYPACDGAAIVVLDTFENLQGVNVQVRESLEAHPGARYLNTDAACDSIERPSHDRGNRFLIYRWAGRDEEQVCALIESTGTHGFWLRDGVEPGERVECST